MVLLLKFSLSTFLLTFVVNSFQHNYCFIPLSNASCLARSFITSKEPLYNFFDVPGQFVIWLNLMNLVSLLTISSSHRSFTFVVTSRSNASNMVRTFLISKSTTRIFTSVCVLVVAIWCIGVSSQLLHLWWVSVFHSVAICDINARPYFKLVIIKNCF